MVMTRAAVLREQGHEQWWTVEDVEVDEPKAGEVLVRFEASGMCHSDDHVRTGDLYARLPIVGGHEGAGVVEAVGPGVRRVAVGDHVVCAFIPACGHCRYCSTGRQNLCDEGRNISEGCLPDGSFRFHSDGADVGGMCMLGTFAQRAVVSEYSCVPYQPDIAPEVAALVGCGVTTGWGSAVYSAGVGAGDTVVVVGIGGVGINAVQGARYAGAQNVIAVDPVPFKLEKAMAFGATHVAADMEAAVQLVTDVTRGQLADHAILTVGLMTDDVVAGSADLVGKDGQVTLTGIGNYTLGVPGHGMTLFQRRYHGALFGGANPLHDIPKLLDLYRAGQLDLEGLITRRYRLDEVNQGYRDMLDGKNIRGVIIHEKG